MINLDTLVYHVCEKPGNIHIPDIHSVYQQILAANNGKYPNILLLPEYNGHENWEDELHWIEGNFDGERPIPIMLDVFGGGPGETPTPQLTINQILAAMAVADVRWLRFSEVVSWHIEHQQPFPTEYVTSILNFCVEHSLKLFWTEWKVDSVFQSIQTYIEGFEDIVVVSFSTNSGDLEPDKGFAHVKSLFEHWGGSMIAYYSNGNPLVIMRVLRHKSFNSSRKYIHTIEFKEEDFETATATTPEEIQQLGKAGWTKYDEMTFGGVQMHFYRKPKRFGGFKNMDNKDETRVDRFLCSV